MLRNEALPESPNLRAGVHGAPAGPGRNDFEPHPSMLTAMSPESAAVNLHCGVCGEGFEPSEGDRGMLEEALASDPTAKPYLRCLRSENSARY